jgi:uncharacterized protein YbjT (DUF2867 family)
MDKRILAVVGATGSQGGGVVNAALADKNSTFQVRGITRHPDSEKAKALASRGVEMVRADVDDVDSLIDAFDGAHSVYCMTNFWEHMSPQRETRQGENQARAAAKAKVAHAIWSTFEDTRLSVPLHDGRMPTLMKRYKVPHFDAKAEVDHTFFEDGVPTTLLYTSFYWENMINFGLGPKEDRDGILHLAYPMGGGKLPGIACGDIGGVAYEVFKRGSEFIGKAVGVAGEQLTGAQMAQALQKRLKRDVVYDAVEPDDYRAAGFPGAEEMGNMFQYKRDFEKEYCAIRDVAMCRLLYPKLKTFDQWLTENAERIPLR